MSMNVKGGKLRTDFPIILLYSLLVFMFLAGGIRFLRVVQSHSGYVRAGLAYLVAGQSQKKEVRLK